MKQEVDGIPYRTSDLNRLILQRSTPKKLSLGKSHVPKSKVDVRSIAENNLISCTSIGPYSPIVPQEYGSSIIASLTEISIRHEFFFSSKGTVWCSTLRQD
jgi:hypothetical protein